MLSGGIRADLEEEGRIIRHFVYPLLEGVSRTSVACYMTISRSPTWPAPRDMQAQQAQQACSQARGTVAGISLSSRRC